MSLVLLWFAIVIVVPAVLVLAVWRMLESNKQLQVLLVLVGLASVGATVGIVGGLSRTGVAGEVLAAALGLLGAVATWMFAADLSKGVIVSVCAVAFSLSIFLGYSEAALRRIQPETYHYWKEQCVSRYFDKDADPASPGFVLMDATMGDTCARIFRTELELLNR